MDDKKKCGCGCGCEEHKHEDVCECDETCDCCDCEDDEVITLVSDDGSEQDFFTLATFDLDGKWYIVLEPATPIEGFEEGDVLIYRLEDENGEDVYLPIESEEEMNKAFAEFNRLVAEDEAE